MASDLKWKTGFGWGAVTLLVATAAGTLLTRGIIRWLSLCGFLLVTTFAIYQFRKWNKRGWRKLHFRAMLAYARIAGRETALSKQEGRPFSRAKACFELGVLMCGRDRAANVGAMVSALEQEKGSYLANLIRAHGRHAIPELDEKRITLLADHLLRVEFGPQLVIANVVENSYGGVEAARYAVALAKGEAH